MKPLLFLILTAFLLLGCEDPDEKKAEELYNMATKYAENRQFKEAIQVLQNLRINFEETQFSAAAEDTIAEYEKLEEMLQSNQQKTVHGQFTKIQRALENYKARFLVYPIGAQDLDKLPKLVAPDWNDAWSRPIQYAPIYSSPDLPKHAPDGYALASFGEDGLPGGDGPNRDHFFKNGQVVQSVLP